MNPADEFFVQEHQKLSSELPIESPLSTNSAFLNPKESNLANFLVSYLFITYQCTIYIT